MPASTHNRGSAADGPKRNNSTMITKKLAAAAMTQVFADFDEATAPA